MTRKEFTEAYCEAVAKGRIAHIQQEISAGRPTSPMRKSEQAAARVHDQKRAVGLWRRNRSYFTTMDLADFDRALRQVPR